MTCHCLARKSISSLATSGITPLGTLFTSGQARASEPSDEGLVEQLRGPRAAGVVAAAHPKGRTPLSIYRAAWLETFPPWSRSGYTNRAIGDKPWRCGVSQTGDGHFPGDERPEMIRIRPSKFSPTPPATAAADPALSKTMAGEDRPSECLGGNPVPCHWCPCQFSAC